MKKIKKILLSLLAVFSLASCASKCSFDTYCSKVAEIKDNEFTTCRVVGTTKDGNTTTKIDITLTKSPLLKIFMTDKFDTESTLAMGYVAITASTFATSETEGVTYYAGSTFKVVTENDNGKATYTFNEYGLLTGYSSSTANGSTVIGVTYK